MLRRSQYHDVQVISGFSKAKARLDKFSKVEGWTLHDLRRSAASRPAPSGTTIAPFPGPRTTRGD